MNDVSLILGIFSLSVAVASAAGIYFGAIRGLDVKFTKAIGDQNSNLAKEMGQLELRFEQRLSKLEPVCIMMQNVIQNEIPKWLHSPHSPELDRLLEKLSTGDLTQEEIGQMITMLRAEMDMANPDYGKKFMIALEIEQLKQLERKNELA
jgi:hypothetical protein